MSGMISIIMQLVCEFCVYLACFVIMLIIVQVQLIEDDKSFLEFPRIEEINELIDKSGCDLPLKVIIRGCLELFEGNYEHD